MLKKTGIAVAVGTIATGLVLVAAPAQAHGPHTINQVNNIIPITICGNNVLGIVVGGPSVITCNTAITYQWG